MEDKSLRPREQQVVELLLQGCDNDEISKQLNMARRTVKAHFNRLFMRFGITGGVKRVKLATLLYRRQLCSEAEETQHQTTASSESSSLSLKDLKTKKSPFGMRRAVTRVWSWRGCNSCVQTDRILSEILILEPDSSQASCFLRASDVRSRLISVALGVVLR